MIADCLEMLKSLMEIPALVHYDCSGCFTEEATFIFGSKLSFSGYKRSLRLASTGQFHNS